MQLTDQIMQSIEQQTWLEPVSKTTQTAVEGVYRTPSAQRVRNMIHSDLLGYPLHVALNDLPIGAWGAAMAMDVLEMTTGQAEYGRAADKAIGFGIVTAALAALAGFTDLSYTRGYVRRIGTLHGLLNTAGLILYTTAMLVRGRSRRTRRGLAMLAYVMLPFSAFLGRRLVHTEGVGVNLPRRHAVTSFLRSARRNGDRL